MWPFRKREPERRNSGGDFSDAVVRLIEAQAAGSAADASSTAAVEAAAGALSRALSSAEVRGRHGYRKPSPRRFWGRWGAIWCAPGTPCT